LKSGIFLHRGLLKNAIIAINGIIFPLLVKYVFDGQGAGEYRAVGEVELFRRPAALMPVVGFYVFCFFF